MNGSEMGQGLAYGLRGKNSLEGMREGGEKLQWTHKASLKVGMSSHSEMGVPEFSASTKPKRNWNLVFFTLRKSEQLAFYPSKVTAASPKRKGGLRRVCLPNFAQPFFRDFCFLKLRGGVTSCMESMTDFPGNRTSSWWFQQGSLPEPSPICWIWWFW